MLPTVAVLIVAMTLVACNSGPSEAEIASRLDELRTEPVLITAPPAATLIREFEKPPFNLLGSFESGGSVITVWASDDSVEELAAWYQTQFAGTYEFATLPDLKGGFRLTESRSPLGNVIYVEIAADELKIGARSFNQDTHPGMTFVSVQVGRVDY